MKAKTVYRVHQSKKWKVQVHKRQFLEDSSSQVSSSAESSSTEASSNAKTTSGKSARGLLMRTLNLIRLSIISIFHIYRYSDTDQALTGYIQDRTEKRCITYANKSSEMVLPHLKTVPIAKRNVYN